MAVNQQHVESLLRQVPDDATSHTLIERADELADYVARGKTLPDPGTGENVSPETLAEVTRLLRERAAEAEAASAGDVDHASRPAE